MKMIEKIKVRCNYCGKEKRVALWRIFIKRIFKERWYDTCPRCHKTSCYRLIPNVIHDSTDKKEKQLNKDIQWDDRIRVI